MNKKQKKETRTAIRIVLQAVTSGSITYEDAEILINTIYHHSTTTDT